MIIDGERWSATILSSPETHSDDLIHLTATVDADTKDDAAAGAKCIMDLFAKGRDAFIRVQPEVTTQKNFEMDKIEIRGYVRFSFKLAAGEWIDVSHGAEEVSYIGAQK